MLGLWVAVRELQEHRAAARRWACPSRAARSWSRPVLPPGCRGTGSGAASFRSSKRPRRMPVAPRRPSPPPPWQDEAATRERPREPSRRKPSRPAPRPKPKRNLLFSSTSRKERERAQARTSEPLPPDLLSPDLRPNPPAAPPPPVPAEAQPPSFDDAWPKPERSKPGETAAAAARPAHALDVRRSRTARRREMRNSRP